MHQNNFPVALFDRPPSFLISYADDKKLDLIKFYEEPDPEAAFTKLKDKIRGILSYSLSKPLNDSFLSQLPNLEIITHHGVGYDAIDAKWCGNKNIIVTHTPNVLNDEVADLALGLLLSTTRQLPQADAFVRSGKWAQGSFPLSASLRGRKLGIMGLGRIGKEIAKRAETFGLEISYYNRKPVDGCAYTYCGSLLELATHCDILLLIAPGTADTKNIVNAEIFKALGADGIFINVARGSLVDEQALIYALKNKVILAAGLDVYENEPTPNPEFFDLPNTVLLPHVGSASHATRLAMAQLVVDNMRAYIDGKGPLTPVPETPWKK